MVIRRPNCDISIEVWGSPTRNEDGRTVSAAAAFMDISRRKNLEAELRTAAEIDQLTGLKNRASLLRELARGIQRVERISSSLAIGFVDLDNFSVVNDTYGRGFGYEVLRNVAGR
jgi:GGDEF domain-containing protein